MNHKLLYIVSILLCLWSCTSDEPTGSDIQPLFRVADNEAIGIDFINELSYDRDFNVYKYRNYYNGGGVALGDVNNDGWTDIYFTGNLKSNKLYLSNGEGSYNDITESAGVGGTKSWSTGVTMVDINADGYLDIYVCNSGDIAGDNKENELFINNGDLTFTESAADYGLNDGGYSTHASFFDYDKDGDLDVYLLNNSYQAIGSFNLRINERPKRDAQGGDKLLQNNNGVYTDVSESAGIYGSVIGFGLGITVGDVNNDNWEDIYVSNDFFERDYLYINQQDGTFKEVLVDQVGSISGASMGADMADVDNDGNADLFVTEMLPSDPERLKSVTTFEDWNKYQYNLKNGYHHQFTRNTLQYNNGDGTFSELGRYAGVEASDWSWGALFFDMNNDGLKDLFVANGIYQDLTNQDYLQYIANEQVIKSIIQDDGVNYKELIDIIPSNPVPNHFYLNKGQLSFERVHDSSTDVPTFSNGSAYGDLDNDGDLDLVINNVNMPPQIYINQTDLQDDQHFVTVSLRGDRANLKAIGARIIVTAGDSLRIENQVQPARGFQSSVDFKQVIGVGKADRVDVKVIWPDESTTILSDQSVNQHFNIEKSNNARASGPIGDVVTQAVFSRVSGLEHRHQENNFSDFNRERLIYHMKSNDSPAMAMGDLDGDGRDDLVITGAKGDNTKIYYQKSNGWSAPQTLRDRVSDQEHTDVAIFDANGDEYLDIYLASGGVDVSPFSQVLYDELWLSDGAGSYTMSAQQLPNAESNISSSVVFDFDYDGDGDRDLFVGEQIKIGKYGAPCSGFILENDGSGAYSDVTATVAPEMQGIGMISDATHADLDGDGVAEIILVGEFMGVEIFRWRGDEYERYEISEYTSLKGWYNTVKVVDLDGDNLPEILLGNHGVNSRFQASVEQPISLYFNDFDKNSFPEGILTHRRDGKDYPYALRHNLIDQLKFLKRRFPDFESYKNASITDIFTPEEMEGTETLTATHLRTSILRNKGGLNFESISLPKEVQFSPVYAIATADFDGDGDLDILMGGNQYNALPEAGIYDASYGVYLENMGDTGYRYVPARESGIRIKGQVRDMIVSGGIVLVAMNNDLLLSFSY